MHNLLNKLKPYGVLLLVLVIAYLPVCTFYFGMKNDAFSDNFPNKFFISEALSTHHLPLWNPYLNYGFPVYADMGFAFYNPITWVFAYIGYNAYTLTIEVLLYIYLGGIFMYRLGKYLGFANGIAITVAAMYMCSGFYTGSMEYINFLTAAAFLPLVLCALLKLLQAPIFINSFKLAIAVYFVFAGGHPAIPIMLVYFIITLLALAFILNKPYRLNWKKIVLYLSFAVILFVLFYLPAIYSYINVLPHYARSVPEPQYTHTDVGFTFSSYLSFIYPFASGTQDNFFGTDMSMRNGFFSVVGVIGVLCCIKSKQKHARLFLITGIIMLLFSAGGPIKAVLFNLPLLNYIRSNGEYRVFAILCFCALAGFGLQQLSVNEMPFKKYFITWLTILLIVSTGLISIVGIMRASEISGALKSLHNATLLTQKIKLFLASPFSVLLIVSAIITLLVCLLSINALKKQKFKLLLLITIADVCLNSIIYLPITGVGQITLKSIQAVYNTSPAGIPVPPLTPVDSIPVYDKTLAGLVGDACYYNKKIGTKILTNYPSYFFTTEGYFKNKVLVAQVSANPWLFIKQRDTSLPKPALQIQSFIPQHTTLQVTAGEGDTLVLLQNNYKFWRAIINNKTAATHTVYTTFTGVILSKGANEVLLYYSDRWLFGCCIISLLAFLAALVIAYRSRLTYK